MAVVHTGNFSNGNVPEGDVHKWFHTDVTIVVIQGIF